MRPCSVAFVLVFAILGLAQVQGLEDAQGKFLVFCIIVSIGMSFGGLTGYAINPARDLGPRLAHALLPIKDKGSSHWEYAVVPLFGPIAGALVAVALYNACKATVKVADGVEISLAEDTRYPFEETVEFTVGTPRQVTFPLYLRIPSWCKGARAKVNGKTVGGDLAAGKYLRIEREWQDGDKVALELPMAITTRSWQVNKNSVSVDYGPLTLSLKIGERYVTRDSRECVMGDSRWQEDADVNAWPSYEIFPTTDWNYALAMDAGIVPVRGAWPADDNPFTAESAPITFKAKGRIVPEWTIDEYGLTGVLPYEDAPKSKRLDDITLIPMGAARLRISAFPTCSAN